jgi:uncharacterized protein (DUF2336 family)
MGLIDDLEDALAETDVTQRAEVLRRVTELFSAGSEGFSAEQVALFDDIMCRLIEEIDVSARAKFGRRLIINVNVPPKVARALALDDSIDVAGPVLSGCERIDENALLEGARTKSQNHLLAISLRSSLGEAVTDVLVERGDRAVALSTAANPGARFSEFGYSRLVKRSENDSDLALHLWSRPDIPRQHLLELFTECSDAVRRKLEATNRRNAAVLRELVVAATERLQAEARDGSAEHAAARERVHALARQGALDEAALRDFARNEKFDETALALSLMCELPIGVIERAMVDENSEQIVVLARACHLSWATTEAILSVRSGRKPASRALEQSFASFNKLKPETAEKAMLFYRLRQRATRRAAG